MIPGEYELAEEEITCNPDSDSVQVMVTNNGDRPIQVGSHYHFYEANNGLEFDRDKAYGKRLEVPSGASVRFEPGDKKEVDLIDFKGDRKVFGFHNEVNGPLD